MGNMHLVTGYQGQEHVTAADHGSLYAAIFGQDSYVLVRGNMFAATLIASNKVRIADGDLVIQGRHVRLNEGKTVDLTIENGSQGRYRIDIIVARYTRNASTGVEDANLVVIKGTASTSSPTYPNVNEGNILNDHAMTADFPLYCVYLNGVTIEAIEPVFNVSYLVTVGYDGKIPSEYLPSMNYIPTSYRGAANGVASLDSTGKVPSGQLPSMDYIPTSQKGAASGVAPLDASRKIDSTYLPSMDYIPTSQKGAASGVAPLNASKKIDSTYLPSMDYISTSQKGAASGVAPLDSTKAVPIENGGTGATGAHNACQNLQAHFIGTPTKSVTTTNLNDVTEPGVYRSSSTAKTNVPSNWGDYGFLIVEAWSIGGDGTNYKQTYRSAYSSNGIHYVEQVRYGRAYTWTAWTETINAQ